ncbi:Atu4866 domain-containing protein [Pedobacter sp. SAFR-022]|uniref:Atu4866 domain-containing protein n=1 Tax=Pedobacter sp. SAFR-022 TaxID=3436861 RepID=UPI003F810DB8
MTQTNKTIEETKEYLGMWVTEDGYIRHELLSNNRYDEARGKRKNAYRGSYQVTGNHIDYQDDTGFIADGEFREGILYHAGMILYKEGVTKLPKTNMA